ncbi:MAG TPA: thioesterase family protein [Panacibacter sp.]|nr:thioesterase family protein [Panacibacter sp.]HNP45314.1 thioesterase family protein [Panacibacter sp.]
MDRIKIKLPTQFGFATKIRIRITDLNFGGHVGNDTFLSLLHEARHAYLTSLGYGELSFEGVGLIMSDVAIEYKKELSQGDEVLIAVAAEAFDKYGFDLFYKMEVVNVSGNLLAAKAKTGMLCYDYSLKRVVSLPTAAIEKLKLTIG